MLGEGRRVLSVSMFFFYISGTVSCVSVCCLYNEQLIFVRGFFKKKQSAFFFQSIRPHSQVGEVG